MQNSNETDRSGHVTKQGDKLARTVLAQCSLIALARKFLGVTYYSSQELGLRGLP